MIVIIYGRRPKNCSKWRQGPYRDGESLVKIVIFDNDATTLELLKIFLTRHGHEVQVFPEPHICSFNLLDDNQCPSTAACADAVMINMRTPALVIIDFLTGLMENGCKMSMGNRAIMSAAMTDQQEQQLRDEGLHVIRKPFRLAEVLEWVHRAGQQPARRSSGRATICAGAMIPEGLT
jgi:DNA-binding response OmpR family regulator